MKTTNLIDQGYYWLDAAAREGARLLARRVSRRNFLSRLGVLIAGAYALPLLPVARAFSQESDIKEVGDPKTCDYWRYCALGGTLCACCGGTHKSCPPGSEPSPITWVGTCRNPVDDRDYLISYNDCCGKAVCARCGCGNSERDRPVYYPTNSNSILWCFGTEYRSYHCTVAVVLGEAAEQD
jgi:methylamine dehydrogenase light chain